MKLDNKRIINGIVKPVIVIVLIVTIVAALVAVTHTVTHIEDAEKLSGEIVLKAEELLGSAVIEVEGEYDKTVNGVLKTNSGYFAVSVSPLGYSKKAIDMLVIFDSELSVKNLVILSAATQTPGIGDRITDNSFLSKFTGNNGTTEVDVISGATYSSKAVIDGVKTSRETIEKILNKENDE